MRILKIKTVFIFLLVAAILISLVSPFVIFQKGDEITDSTDTPTPKKVMPELIMPTPLPSLFKSNLESYTNSAAYPNSITNFQRRHLQCNFKHLKSKNYHLPILSFQQF